VQTGDCPNPFGTTHSLPPSVVAGVVVEWFGSIVNIPAGWALCDGTQDTPDLRDKFVLPAGGAYAPGAAAGVVQHNHDFTGDSHWHNHSVGAQLAMNGYVDLWFTFESIIGTTGGEPILAPHHALVFIMKL